MYTRFLPLMGLLALTLGGCAYQKAMRAGDLAAEAGDWQAAVAEYEKAKNTKANPEALEAWGAARLQAIDEALDNARIALDMARWEEAMSHIEYVEKLSSDNPDAYTLRGDLRREMRAAIESHWELHNIRTAYTTAVRMRALFPREDLALRFDELRGHYRDEAREHLKARRYEDALASARTILEFEPERASHVAPLEHEILGAWADAEVAEARSQLRARHKGAAALHYARAYEIAGRQDDLSEAQRLAGELGGDHRFDYALRITGSTARAERIRRVVDEAAAHLSDVGDAHRTALTLTVDARGARCDETRTATPQTRDFISGQIEVPNPEHAELTERLARAEQAEREAKAESERLWPEVQKAEKSLAFFDDLVRLGQEQYAKAKARLDRAQAQLDKAATVQAEIEQHLVELRAAGPGTEATIQRRENELAKLAGVVSQWQGEYIQAEMELADAERELKGLEIERQPAAEALERIAAGYKAVQADRTTFAQTVADTRSALARTPTTVMEDVHETLEYEVYDWTRTCKAPLTVSARTTWRTDLPTTQRFTPALSTEDRSHRGHALSELEEDPKAYPDSDEELLGRADDESAAAIGQWLAQLADDYYEVRILETTMALQKDPIRGSDAMLGLFLGAPGRIDEATLLTFKTHARQQFGLEKLELLAGDRTESFASR